MNNETLYELGEKCKKENNYDQALKYYEDAVKEGDMRGKIEIAKSYYFGRGVEKDHKKAFAMFNELIEEKNQYDNSVTIGYIANWYLIDMYYKGFGVEKDYKKAIELINNLDIYNADIGIMQYIVAKMYEKGGYGIEQNTEKSEEFYNKIELDLCLTAMYQTLATLSDEDFNSKQLIYRLIIKIGWNMTERNIDHKTFMECIKSMPKEHPTYKYGKRFQYLEENEFDEIVSRLKEKIEKNEEISFYDVTCEEDVEKFANKIVFGEDKV